MTELYMRGHIMSTRFDDDIACKMRVMYEDGATLQQIVDIYGANRKTISNTIRRVGGEMRPVHKSPHKSREMSKGLKCYPCLKQQGIVNDAVTIHDGQAICINHI
jgi:hypothetical protein